MLPLWGVGKKYGHITVRVDDDEAELLKRAAGGRTSSWIRERAIEAAKSSSSSTSSPAPSSLSVHHVDELGADGLRLNNGAMKR